MEAAVETFRLVGCVRVEPPLGRDEFDYLTAFAESRRWRRPEGSYTVPDNPLAECLDPGLDMALYSVAADGQPGLDCPWAPGHAGRALVPVPAAGGGGGVPPEEVAGWLVYLRDHFLRTGAHAAAGGSEGDAMFVDFGFDHVLDGAAAVCSDRTGEVSVIRMVANRLSVEVLGPGARP